MSLTDDPSDPRLGHGTDEHPGPQNEVYLVLSEEERAKGFIRPLRCAYIHKGYDAPTYPLRDLTEEEVRDFKGHYAKYEPYPTDHPRATLGRYWTQMELENPGNGCGTRTTMGLALCQTYARDPYFYGSTYCCGCQMHRPVGEFVWDEDGQRVGS